MCWGGIDAKARRAPIVSHTIQLLVVKVALVVLFVVEVVVLAVVITLVAVAVVVP